MPPDSFLPSPIYEESPAAILREWKTNEKCQVIENEAEDKGAQVYQSLLLFYPPAIEASREVVSFTGRKNQLTPVDGVKAFVCLSEAKFDLNYFTST